MGKQIQLYVDHNVRDPQDGGMTDGIRIRPYKPRVQKQEPVPPCTDCGNPIEAAMGKNAHWLAAYTTKNYGVPLCAACAQKRKEAAAAAEMQQETETLRKCSRTARLRISRWILTPGRCCNGPSCCHSGELLLS